MKSFKFAKKGAGKSHAAAAKQKGEENDPTSLKRRIAELEKQAKNNVCAVPPRKEVIVEKPVLLDKNLKQLQVLMGRMRDARGDLRQIADAIETTLDQVSTAISKVHASTTTCFSRRGKNGNGN